MLYLFKDDIIKTYGENTQCSPMLFSHDDRLINMVAFIDWLQQRLLPTLLGQKFRSTLRSVAQSILLHVFFHIALSLCRVVCSLLFFCFKSMYYWPFLCICTSFV